MSSDKWNCVQPRETHKMIVNAVVGAGFLSRTHFPPMRHNKGVLKLSGEGPKRAEIRELSVTF